MGKTAKNLSIALGLATVAFAGYYLYTQYYVTQDGAEMDAQKMQKILDETQIFIARGEILQTIQLDLSLFDDAQFQALRSFSTPIKESPVGRPDPFSEKGATANKSNS